MRRKLFVSAGMVLSISVLSVAALVNASRPIQVSAEGVTVVKEKETVSAPLVIKTDPVETSSTESVFKSIDWDAYESYLLAKIAMAEAESEDTEGKALVMLVVLNRVWSDGFPDSIEEVIFQTGQFSPVANGRFDSVEPDRDCWDALDLIMQDHWDESQGALYFESESASTWHRDNLEFLFRHGNHLFYTEKEQEDE